MALRAGHQRRARHHYDFGTSERVRKDSSSAAFIHRRRRSCWRREVSFHSPIDPLLTLCLRIRKSNIEWECDNGGQLWTASAAAGYGSGTAPSGFCTAGFSSIYAAFIVGLLVDLVFQVRLCFLCISAMQCLMKHSLSLSDVYALSKLEVFETSGALPRDERALFRRYVWGALDRGFLFFHMSSASGQID